MSGICAKVDIDDSSRGLVDQGLDLIEARYGKEEADSSAEDHNADFVRRVVTRAALIADVALSKNMISPREKRLLVIAAAFRFAVQDFEEPEANLHASAVMANEAMINEGVYCIQDRTTVRRAIMEPAAVDSSDDPTHRNLFASCYMGQLLSRAAATDTPVAGA